MRPDEPGEAKVLAAGRELFAERGYHAASVADIGARASISKSVIYHHFGSKAGLYRAILEAETRDLVDRVTAALPGDPGQPRLRAGVDAYLAFLAERPATWRLLLRDPPTDPSLRELHDELADRRSTMLAEVLAAPAKRQRSAAHVDLVATAIRAFAIWWHDHDDVPRARVVDAVAAVAEAFARGDRGGG